MRADFYLNRFDRNLALSGRGIVAGSAGTRRTELNQKVAKKFFSNIVIGAFLSLCDRKAPTSLIHVAGAGDLELAADVLGEPVAELVEAGRRSPRP